MPGRRGCGRRTHPRDGLLRPGREPARRRARPYGRRAAHRPAAPQSHRARPPRTRLGACGGSPPDEGGPTGRKWGDRQEGTRGGISPAPCRPLGSGDRLCSRTQPAFDPGGGALEPALDRSGGGVRGEAMPRRTAGRPKGPASVLASDHRGVAEAVRNGWADAGVCLRLVSEEAGLDFLRVREEAYDLCFSERCGEDLRIRALLDVVRSPSYRKMLSQLPGYNSAETGDLQRVT